MMTREEIRKAILTGLEKRCEKSGNSWDDIYVRAPKTGKSVYTYKDVYDAVNLDVIDENLFPSVNESFTDFYINIALQLHDSLEFPEDVIKVFANN